MQKSDYFETEIEFIKNDRLKDFTRFCLNEKIPAWFWKTGASSSGKFHPQFAQGYGGLVRHSKAVTMFAMELLNLNTYKYGIPAEMHDLIPVACILHDTAKYGMDNEMDTSIYKYHGINGAILVANAWHEFFGNEYPECPECLWRAIMSHMGQWSIPREHKPYTTFDRLVHTADYIASRNFIDIPAITEDYLEVAQNDKDYCIHQAE